MERRDLAIVALTPRGRALGRRLADSLGQGEVRDIQGSARETLQELFHDGRPLVCIMALGIVVRLLGPLLGDKRTDPAVVLVDEAGRFAISVVGGHAQNANAMAAAVARALGAVPVITTASEALGLPAIDLLGRERGWKIESTRGLTAVAAAVVRGEAVAVYQDAGWRDWWTELGDWPASFERIAAWPREDRGALLAISDRVHPIYPGLCVIHRPPSLVLGVGCRRGVSAAEIEALFQRVCSAHGFAPLSLGIVATASIKADEPGLREFAAQHGVPLRSFALEELAAVAPLPTPSAAVQAKIGIPGVAEPAALLAAGATTLLLPKQRGARVTLALARKEDA